MSKTISLQQRTGLGTLLLVGLLALLTVCLTYAISVYGVTTGFLILVGIFGFAALVACFLKPTFGFYLCLSLAFVVAAFERLFYGIITLDFAVEILTYATLSGQVYRKYAARESFWKGMRHPINYLMLAYLAYLLLECLNPNTSAVGALFSLRKTIQIASLYVLALSLFRSYQSMQRFVYFWIVAAGLCGAYACYQQWVGFPAFEWDWIHASEVRVAIYRLDNGSFRKFSTLTDPAAFGILMGVSSLLTIATILNAPAKRQRIWFSLLLLFQLLGLSFSGTRTSVFAVIAGLGLYILMTLNQMRTMLFAVFCALVFGFLMFAPIYGNIPLNRFRSAFYFNRDASYEVRNINRARIQPYIYAHPFGGGPMSTGTNGLRFNPNHTLAGFPTDSGFLRSALEFGWVGLSMVCLLFFVILQQGVHAFYRTRHPLARAFLIGAVIALFGNMVSQYSQVAIGASPQIFIYTALIALIVNISKLETKQNVIV